MFYYKVYNNERTLTLTEQPQHPESRHQENKNVRITEKYVQKM